ncbi:hypothetical protein JW962_04060 [Candidatus Dojkabacteria bacterium]|nr:hypothetical protein [Candidatus Dojkabacteria bacterium]
MNYILGVDLSSFLNLNTIPLWAIIVYGVMVVFLGMIGYVIKSFIIYKIAQKLNAPNDWQSWVPVLRSMYRFELGDQNKWLYLLSYIPCIGVVAFVFGIIACIKILSKLGKPTWHIVLFFVPVVNLIYMITLAL